MSVRNKDFREDLLRHYSSLRPPGSGANYNFHADALFMLSQSMLTMAAMCQSKAWPAMFQLMEPKTEGDLIEGLAEMHQVVARLLKISDTVYKPDDLVDATIYEAMDSAGWEKVSIEARTSYLAMLGLYHLSRVWVATRQSVEHTLTPGVSFETIAQCAGELMRSKDQGVSSIQMATQILTVATQHAIRCGFNLDDVSSVTRNAALQFRAEEPIDYAVLSAINPTRVTSEVDGGAT